jgi:hypothetical protein
MACMPLSLIIGVLGILRDQRKTVAILVTLGSGLLVALYFFMSMRH